MQNVNSIFLNAASWYLITFLLGAVSYGCWRQVAGTTRAWVLARLLGPYLLTTLIFIPRLWQQDPFLSPTGIALSALAVAALSFWLLRGQKRTPALTREILNLVYLELAALGLFALGALYSLYVASVDGPSERLMNTAFWVALHTQRTFPLEDPWLAGFALRYYALGYYPIALPGILTGIDPLRSYNLALSTCFSLYGLAVGGVLLSAGLTAARTLAGMAVLCLGGNFQSTIQAAKLLAARIPFDWHAPIVAVRDGITEFPLWSFSQSNLHPHFIANFLLGALLLVIPRIARRPAVGAVLVAALGAWITGAHPWELPVFLGVVLCSLAVMALRTGKAGAKPLGLFAGLAIISFALISLPFHIEAPRFGVTLGWTSHHSSLEEILKAYALFLVPLWCFLLNDRITGVVVLIGLGLSVSLNQAWPVLLASVLGLAYWNRREEKFPVEAVAGVGLLLICEWLYVNDPVYPGTRLASIHKWYPCAWTLLGIAVLRLLPRLESWWPRRTVVFAGSLWALALSTYFFLGLPSRAQGFRQAKSYDGLVATAQTGEDDLRMIRWMRDKVRHGMRGVLLEPLGSPYGTGTRYSSLTGLPSFMACPDCAHLLQFHREDPTIEARIRLSQTLYADPQLNFGDCDKLNRTLQASSISYLVWSAKTARNSSPAARAYLEGCLTAIHQEGSATLLAVK